MKVNIIKLPWESYLYLDTESRKQLGQPERSEKSFAWLRHNFDRFVYKGHYAIEDGCFAGCANGRKTLWSVETMARMLDEAGLPYERGESEVFGLELSPDIRR